MLHAPVPILPQLRALADPRRLRLVEALRAESRTANQLAQELGLRASIVRAHLRVLAEAGLVRRFGSRRPAVYQLNRSALAALGLFLSTTAPPPVVSIVAKSGTGKTTFMEKLIPQLVSRGARIGVIKHHGHPTPFDLPGKDTYRHAQAGAEVVVGASAVQVAVFRQENGAHNLEEVIARHFAGLDLVLTEGYKRGPFPKIEVHRAARSTELLCRPEELIALVSDRSWPFELPQFSLEDADGVADFLLGWMVQPR